MNPGEQLDPNHLPSELSQRQALAQELKGLTHAARARGDLLTAMLHASDALLLFPNEREFLNLVDEVALSTQDPLSLVPVASGSVHVATAAARARILMMKKDMLAAIELIAEVVRAAPEISYLPWVQRWLAQPGVLARYTWEQVGPVIVRTALPLAGSVPVPPDPSDERLPNVVAGAHLFELLRAQFPQESVLYSGEVLLRRRLGDPNATLAVAIQGVQRFPQDPRLQIAMLNALRDAKRPDEALAHARKALELDPSDGAPLYDAAWAFADADRPVDAVRVFEELIARFPDYPGVRGAYHAVRFRVSGSHEDRVALVTLREREWWNDEVVSFANAIDPVRPYFNYLPGPGDATASAGRHLVRELAAVIHRCGVGLELQLGVESQYLDSPSVPLAFDLALRSLGARGQLTIPVCEVQTPDPRADKAQVPFRLWGYEGTTPQRQFPPADPRAQSAIAGLAATLFRVETWDPAARTLAQQMGPEWLNALLSVMTDPPTPPDGSFDAFTWTYRCQVAAALVLSHIGPFQNGPGRTALNALLYGPSDWVTDAAVIAFGFRALTEPAVRPEVEAIFGWLRTQIPLKGYTSFEPVLAQVWLGLGNHSPAHQSGLEEWIEEIDEELPSKNRVQPPTRRYGGLTLEQYAEFSFERDRIMGNVSQQGVGAAVLKFVVGQPPPELSVLCQRFNVPMLSSEDRMYPYIREWQEALNANSELQEQFLELQRSQGLRKIGVSADEQAALHQIRSGEMDMHLRMAQQQAAQRAANEGSAGDPDPLVFPGQKVQKLSDYVRIMKRMQGGDFMGAISEYGLDTMSYSSVATAWGAKFAADPTLNEKFSRMMAT
jgi:tetratricopeptide (TPR) repeat protein